MSVLSKLRLFRSCWSSGTSSRIDPRVERAAWALVESLEVRINFGVTPTPYSENPIPAAPPPCNCPPVAAPSDPKTSGPAPSNKAPNPVRYLDGLPVVSGVDLASDAFGFTWGHTRSWTGLENSSFNGNGWSVEQLAYLVFDNKNASGHNQGYYISEVTGGINSETFATDDLDTTTITSRYTSKDTLNYDATNHLFVLTDSMGGVTKFYDLRRDVDGNLWTDPPTWDPSQKWGQFKSYTNAAGVEVEATYNTDGTVQYVDRYALADPGTKERWAYSYTTLTNSAGASATVLASVTMETQDSGGTLQSVRAAAYTYYNGYLSDGTTADPNGRFGDLKLVEIKTPSGAVIDTSYYRYSKVTGEALDATWHSVGPTNDRQFISGAFVDKTGGVIDTDATGGVSTGGANGTLRDLLVLSELKSEVTGASFDRLKAAHSDYASVSDDDLKPYADHFFRYERWAGWNDDTNASTNWQTAYQTGTRYRVVEESAQGSGCSSCTGGQGNSKYEYTLNTASTGRGERTTEYNVWRMKTTVYLPDDTNADANSDGQIDDDQWTDNDQEVVYTNEMGQVMLDAMVDTNGTSTTADDTKYITYYRYSEPVTEDGNDGGRLLLVAHPSAVTGYDDSFVDLVDFDDASYVSPDSGLIDVYTYGDADDMGLSDSHAGDVEGYLKSYSIRNGYLGGDVPQEVWTYFKRTGDEGTVLFPTATDTVYRNSDGTGAETVSYTYHWSGTTAHMTDIAVTLPTVSGGENGPGTADVETTFFDSYGRPQWHKDADGYISYTEYAPPEIGGTYKTIADVDTSQTGDFSNKPSGWSTPSGGGLHLVANYQVDGLGRTTKQVSPSGNVTFTVYNDANHEVRTYSGFDAATGTTTGPIQVAREYRPTSSGVPVYDEVLTTSATPHLTGGVPDGTETISASNIQSLSRQITNDAGQVVEQDDYFNLSGQTYSASAARIGSSSVSSTSGSYHVTLYAYDGRGRQAKVTAPTLTITRAVYDVLGRQVSRWVGTDDTPTSGYWSPNNTAGTDLVKLEDDEYDGGGVGDSNLTKVTLHPTGSASTTFDRVSQMFYDWRDRQVAAKAGVQGTEGTSTQRIIVYTDFDNLGEPTANYQYDGDNVSITDANSDGVPDKPSSSLLRAKTTADYDDQARVYRTSVFSVDPSSGTVSSNALKTDSFYNHRGNVIKATSPGGLITKSVYDGAGRLSTSYSTDGGGDSSWSDAANVTGDKVLEETINTYDADGNVILVTTKQRFNDETATGDLGNATTSPKARVSYQSGYYDKADRLTDSVDVGTNAGSSYTRPGSVPSRSDTVLVTSNSYDAAGRLSDVTDPKGLITHSDYDLLGRQTRVVNDYTNGTPTDSTNQTTRYTYDGLDHVLTLTADMPSGQNDQVTAYVYGVTTGGGSDFNSNDLLKEVDYPNKTTGAANSSDKETYTYNTLGDVKTMADRNGNTHTYGYDVLGRQLSDAVTTLGTGVDGTVRRIEASYNTQGLPEFFTTYNASSSGTIVGQVQRASNGLGQLITEYQAISGSVNTSTTPKVQYAYTEMASGVNNSRLKSITYPTGRIVRYEYNSGLDDSISRLSYLADDASGSVGNHLEEYSYLGLGTVVQRNHPQPGLDLSLISPSGSTADAGDKYVGLDRFGRVADQRWIDEQGSGSTDDIDADRFQYTYDRDSDVASRDVTATGSPGNIDESYTYDNLNRLTKMNLGTLASGTITDANATFTQRWDGGSSGTDGSGLDALGNWKGVTTDTNGGASGGSSTVTHTVNSQNQLTAVSGGATTPVYDNAGNMTRDESGQLFVYDAWNHQVQVKNSSGTAKATYTIDPLGRQAQRTTGAAGFGATTRFYYTSSWQVVQEDELVSSTYQPRYQNVWSPVYVDAMVERDTIDQTAAGALDTSFSGDGKFVTSQSAGVDGVRFVQQQDLKIVGIATSGGHVGLVRLNSDGSLDTSFDGPSGSGNGSFVLSLGTADQGLGLAVQDDGKIVLIGQCDGDVAVGRLNVDGSWDVTFTGAAGAGNPHKGWFKLDYGGTTDGGWSAALQNNGQIVICGFAGSDALVARLNKSDGTYDTSFNTTGSKTVDFSSGTDTALRLGIQADGKIVAAGNTSSGGTGGDMAVFRLTTSGALDTTFDTDGKQTISFSSSNDSARSMVIDDQGRIVLAGQGGDNNFDVARLTTAGALDTAFDGPSGTGNGKVSIDFASGTDKAEAVALDGYGHILVSGTAGGTDVGVVRLNPADGTLDTTFDSDGKQTVSFSATPTASETGYALLVQTQDNKVVVAGLSDLDICVARLGGGGARHYLMEDANYNVTGVTDATGRVIDRYRYTPYGTYVALNPNFSTDLDGNGEVYQAIYFQGLRFDGNTGNYVARNRYEDPSLGAWTQSDPSGYLDSLNPYQFVWGDPGAYTDPSGLSGGYDWGYPSVPKAAPPGQLNQIQQTNKAIGGSTDAQQKSFDDAVNGWAGAADTFCGGVSNPIIAATDGQKINVNKSSQAYANGVKDAEVVNTLIGLELLQTFANWASTPSAAPAPAPASVPNCFLAGTEVLLSNGTAGEDSVSSAVFSTFLPGHDEDLLDRGYYLCLSSICVAAAGALGYYWAATEPRRKHNVRRAELPNDSDGLPEPLEFPMWRERPRPC